LSQKCEAWACLGSGGEEEGSASEIGVDHEKRGEAVREKVI